GFAEMPRGTGGPQRGRPLQRGVRLAALRRVILHESQGPCRRARKTGYAVYACGSAVPRVSRSPDVVEGRGAVESDRAHEAARRRGPVGRGGPLTALVPGSRDVLA